jgi:hypothetical protein
MSQLGLAHATFTQVLTVITFIVCPIVIGTALSLFLAE